MGLKTREVGDFVFDVAGFDGVLGGEEEVGAFEGFIVGEHEVDGDVLVVKVDIEEADGGEFVAVVGGEDFDFVFDFALEGVPLGFEAAELDAEGGALLGLSQVDGEFGVSVGVVPEGFLEIVAAGVGGGEATVGEFVAVGIAGEVLGGFAFLGGFGDGVFFVEGEVVAVGGPDGGPFFSPPTSLPSE